MGPQFTIDSGRELYLEQLFFKNTTEGVLVGNPHYLSAAILRRMPDTIRSIFWDCKATLILKPTSALLPRYTFIAHLLCLDSIPAQEPGDYTRMIVAWFQDELDGTLVGLAHRALKQLDWDRHAENWID